MDGLLLFVDFDGVLQTPAYSEFVPFEHMINLEHVLDVCDYAAVVISSSHRVGKSLQDLRDVFATRFQRRVVGSTPELPIGRAKGGRLVEARAFLDMHNLEVPWVAVDDEPDLWHGAGFHLHATHPLLGLDEDSAQYLIKKLDLVQTEWKRGPNEPQESTPF